MNKYKKISELLVELANELSDIEEITAKEILDELTGSLIWKEDARGISTKITEIKTAHNWGCLSEGLYGASYRCSRCNQEPIFSVDTPNGNLPIFGCTG